MATEFTIKNQEMNNVYKDMVDNALALAVVTRDGSVAFHYAKQGGINTDPNAASAIIGTVADLVAQYHKA